ncbi:hypothetical protein [Cellvibrio sp.]|uniref:hypothetical protein n=1 Tax=Cellvibrio sp. TaxID=1965322 RepID=UPI00396488B9
MLKVRIIAAILAILLTLITIWAVPKIAFAYMTFMDGLTPEQRTSYGVAQAILGAAVACYGLWLWKKKAKKKREDQHK